MDIRTTAATSFAGKLLWSTKALIWLVGIVAIGYGATVLQDTFSLAYPGHAWHIGISIWTLFALIYILYLLPFSRMMETGIYKLIAPPDAADDLPSQTSARWLAIAVTATLTLIWLLLLLDYRGHNDTAAYTAGLKDGASHPDPEFLQRVGTYLGPFGDFFGGVLNPILTFGTLIALAITIVMQRAQLHGAEASAQENKNLLQRQLDAVEGNARDNVDLLQKQLNAAEKRASENALLLEKQTFETTFFNMLALHNSTVDRLTFDPSLIRLPLPLLNSRYENEYFTPAPDGGVAVGRQVFARVLQVMDDKNSRLRGLGVYKEIQTHHNYVLGHYFRGLYQILSLIDQYAERKGFDTAKRYSNIIRAQLSSNELLLLLFNCSYTTVDEGEFRALLKRYEILEHLPLKCTIGRLGLSTPGLSFEVEDEVRQYFEVDPTKENLAFLPGAFGKNPEIGHYIYVHGVVGDNS